ncbi:MAG TPA: cation-translocating P-type ATPase [Vicinamibacterales bacterium]|nr:cation-translocating P-type ATPase [Vicinamibacterales bacterium]
MPEAAAERTPPGSRWHALDVNAVADRLKTDIERGLTAVEAARRLVEYGENSLPSPAPPAWWALLARQFASSLILLLIAAATLSVFLGEWIDAAAIAAIVALNAGLGFAQEHRAEQSLAALRSLAVPNARVIRDGEPRTVPAARVVPGDLVLVEAGDRVPADARIAYAAALQTTESSLTGESTPIEKHAGRMDLTGTPLADRANMLFLGTEVASGKARALVVATGSRTELGRIAALIGTAEREPTPLERRLAQLSAVLIGLSVAIVGLVFVLGLMRGEPPFVMFLTAVSLAVAAVPEGLPAMVTVALALGVTRMARRNALVRRLAAVETLGSTTVICTDKTGTLTRGEMRVRTFDAGGRLVDASSAGRLPAVRALLETAVLCSDARLVRAGDGWRATGDPTEAALLLAAADVGIHKADLEHDHPLIFEIPFDPARKRMTVVRRSGAAAVAHVKGAMDVIAPRSIAALAGDGSEFRFDPDAAARDNDAFARESLRVLAFARRNLASTASRDPDDVERDLTWLGLAALEDPLRAEAIEAVRVCRRAGIRVVMITGDHRATAAAVADRLGLLETGGALTGSHLDGMPDAELLPAVQETSVFARVTAEHKLRIVRAWQALGAVVAMTGDGVNDAPALKQADVGVAMGVTGTDVAKDASDMVVTDDNFASIVAAVEEGRRIYANIQRGLQYLLSCNLSEILLMLLAAVFALPLPLLPVQILWTNLVTDGLPALALAVERGDPDAMRVPPRTAGARFVDLRRFVAISRHGLFMAAAPLAAYAWELGNGAGLPEARGVAFSILVLSQLAHALNSRHERESLLTLGPFGNRLLVAACGAAAAIQVAIMAVPPVQSIFGVAPLSFGQWGLAIGLGLLPIAGMELEKFIARRRDRRTGGQEEG